MFSYVLCSIFCFCSVMIFDYLLSMWYIIYFWDFCWDRKLLLGRWGDIFGVMLPKRYAIYAFPVWSKYANYALYLIICGVPKWNHYVRLCDSNMFLHSDFDAIVAWFLWIPYTYMWCDDLVIWYAIYAFLVWCSQVEPLCPFVWFWICFWILILMPLLHDFCEFCIHICHVMNLWYDMLFTHLLCGVPEWNHYVRLCDFEYVSAFWFWCHYCMTFVNSAYIYAM